MVATCVSMWFMMRDADVSPTALFPAAVSASGHILLLFTPGITPFATSAWMCVWMGHGLLLVRRYWEATYAWAFSLSLLIRRSGAALLEAVPIDTTVNPCPPIGESGDMASTGSGFQSSEMMECSYPTMPRHDSVVEEIKQDREDGLTHLGEEDMPDGAVIQHWISGLLEHSGMSKGVTTSQPNGCGFLLEEAPHLVSSTIDIRGSSESPSISRQRSDPPGLTMDLDVSAQGVRVYPDTMHPESRGRSNIGKDGARYHSPMVSVFSPVGTQCASRFIHAIEKTPTPSVFGWEVPSASGQRK